MSRSALYYLSVEEPRHSVFPCAPPGSQSRLSACCVITLSLCAAVLRAERLPIQVYTATDGLAPNTIHRVHRDARGFLWFGASEGLSRYDGYEFITYREPLRPKQRRIREIIDTADGVMWAGTEDGVCRVEFTATTPVYHCAKPPEEARFSVTVLLEERPGELLAGSSAGLYRLKTSAASQFTRVPLGAGQLTVSAILRDPAGALWIGTNSGIYSLQENRVTARLTKREGLPSDEVLALTLDRSGTLWAGTQGGLCQIRPHSSRPVIERVFLTNEGVHVVHLGSENTLWVATSSGLAEALRDAQGHVDGFRAYGLSHGLSHTDIDTLENDRAGNLWIGSESGGVMKLTRGGFVSYGTADGLGSPDVTALTETRAGQICAFTRLPGRMDLNFLEGERFRAVPVPADPSFYSARWTGWYQVGAEAPDGRWWLGSERGLLLSPPDWLRRRAPKFTIFDRRHGIPDDHIYQIFQDSQGGIWVATRYPHAGLTRWDPRTRKFHRFTAADGLPPVENARPNGFGEDSHGQVWIGWWRTGVLRYRNGKLQFFGVGDGVPAGGIRRILTDRRGRVWIGSSDEGVGRIDDPTADRPTFKTYSPLQGLSQAEIQSLTEDSLGRIYAGHGFGVDRIDPDAPGPLRVRRFTTLDGLTGGEQQTSLRDRHGALWFGSVQGVSRLLPGPDRTPAPPDVYITAVRVDGRALNVKAGAVRRLDLASLKGIRDQLQIDFVSPRFASGEIIQYQYRLSETEPWSAPSPQRSVQYAELPSGTHRFELRAINSDGVVSPVTAVAGFQVIAPFWRQWWFLLSLAALLGALAWAWHMFDVRRRLEVQAVRMRIARDLHDQVGTGLSQIAILSEVVQRSPDKEPLAHIADISRELVDSISDIVWAINPARDNLPDLAQRMHRFAADLLTVRNIAIEFQADGFRETSSIRPDVRREVYLIYRECLRNIVRHSRCQRVRVRVAREGGGLMLEVADDGVGFDRSQSTHGTGLASLEDRARSLGGRIEWQNGDGTKVTLRVPLPV